MYKVLIYFTDLQDDNHPYQPEDIFPRAGLVVSDERLAELSGTNNRRGVKLIEKVATEAAETASDAEKERKPSTSAAKQKKAPKTAKKG